VAGVVSPAAADRASQAGAPLSVWRLLRQARLLQVILFVTVVANLVFGGTFEVALPSLAHDRFGPAGYGALIACYGAGSVLGILVAARSGNLRRPTVIACCSFLIAAIAVGLVPFLGGLAGASAAEFVFGASAGFGNVMLITLLQKWAPPQLLGRVMSLLMLASLGSFPASVALSGILVHRLGPVPFFPVAGAALAVAVLGALTQREVRDFGAAGPPEPLVPAEPTVPAEPA
jgi:predicted MFS family arabinose efflux permease